MNFYQSYSNLWFAVSRATLFQRIGYQLTIPRLPYNFVKKRFDFLKQNAFSAYGSDMPRGKALLLIRLRKVLGLRQSEMATRMGLSLRPYQQLEASARSVRNRHMRLAESVAVDVALEKKDMSLVPDKVRKKIIAAASILVVQSLRERPLQIAKSILERGEK
jgi:transcriptional regulator with XRE-family HTH domain